MKRTATNGTSPTKRIERELPVKMSDERIDTASMEMSALVCEQTAIETELAAICGEKRKRLRQIKKDVKRLAQAVQDGQELAMVGCEEEQVFAQNKVIVRRLDTNSVVETRAMSGDDRQMSIDEASEPS